MNRRGMPSMAMDFDDGLDSGAGFDGGQQDAQIHHGHGSVVETTIPVVGRVEVLVDPGRGAGFRETRRIGDQVSSVVDVIDRVALAVVSPRPAIEGL